MNERISSPIEAQTGAPAAGTKPHILNSLIFVLALLWAGIVATTVDPVYNDFKHYWYAGADMLRSGNPYASTPNWADPAIQEQLQNSTMGEVSPIYYPYPPLLAYLIQPLSLMEQGTAREVWFVLNLIAALLFIHICIRGSGSRMARRYWGPVVLISLITPPARLSLQLGQLSIILALLTVGSLLLAQRRPIISGLLLSIGGFFKIYPAALGLFYLRARLWRPVLWCAASTLIIFTISLIPYGVEPYETFFRSIIFSGPYPYAAESNISFAGFWQRLLVSTRYAVAPLNAPGLASALTAICSLATLALCLQAGRSAPAGRSGYLDAGIWLCGLMLITPTNGYYNLVILLLPLLTMLSHLEERPDTTISLWLIAATLLCCVPPTWTEIHPQLYNNLHIGWGILLLTPSFYGILIYLALLVHIKRRLST